MIIHQTMNLMNINRIYTAITIAAASLLCFAGCNFGESEPESVTFMAGFRPQANLPFVAAYVAEEKGYFEEQGLNVDIQHSIGEHLNLLMAGEVDFTTADANSVLKRRADPGLPIVAIALFGQRGQQAFLALSDSGISTPERLGGQDVRVQSQHSAGLSRDPGGRGGRSFAHPGGQGWFRPSHSHRGTGGRTGGVQVQRAERHSWDGL